MRRGWGIFSCFDPLRRSANGQMREPHTEECVSVGLNPGKDNM